MTVGVSFVEPALARWDGIRHTHALRAVDEHRVAREAAAAPDGPLRGLLCSVKDVYPVAGVESCAGSLVLAGNVPRADAPLIAALRSGGAVVLGKGVCAEFGFGVDTENRLDGRVTHHEDPAVSPGGSSGGDAVAVGAGVVDFALAGDYGGSVRWPAQATGVLGMRVGVGTTAASGRLGAPSGQQAQLEVPGILARDPHVLQRVLGALGIPAARRPTRRLVVADPEMFGAVDAPVAAAVESIASAAARRGYAVSAGSKALTAALVEALSVYRRLRESTDTHAGVRRIVAGREHLLCESTRAVLAAARTTTDSADPAEVAVLHRRARHIAAEVRAALAEADGLLLPVAATGAIGFAATVDLGGVLHDATSLHAHLRAISLTGLPALAVPVADHVSVQLVGGEGGEHLLGDLAKEVIP